MSYAQPELQAPHPRSHSHQRNASSYTSAEAASSSAYQYDKETNLDSPPRSPRSPITSVSPRPGPYEGQIRSVSGSSQSAPGDEGFSLEKIGRAIVGRVVRSAKRGNLPFIVIFLSCVLIFFSALAGIGYVDPDTLPSTEAAPFMPGSPIYDPNEAIEIARRKRVEEQRELEKSWQKKKRPKDGAWMQKQRDDKAIRRVPIKVPEPAKVEQYDLNTAGTEDNEEENAGVRKRELSDRNDGLLATRDPWETVGVPEENGFDSAVNTAEEDDLEEQV